MAQDPPITNPQDKLMLIASLAEQIDSFSTTFFETFTRIMPLVFDASEEVRESAITNADRFINLIIKQGGYQTNESWSSIKQMIIETYVGKISEIRGKNYKEWHQIWCLLVRFLDSEMIKSNVTVNTFLNVIEQAFRSPIMEQRADAFSCWLTFLIVLNQNGRECTKKRVRLLCVPLNSTKSKILSIAIRKFEVWWLLICSIYEHLDEYSEQVIERFLMFCFGISKERQSLFDKEWFEGVAPGLLYKELQLIVSVALISLLGSSDARAIEIQSDHGIEILSKSCNLAVLKRISYTIVHSCVQATKVMAAEMPLIDNLWMNLLTTLEAENTMQFIELIIANLQTIIVENADQLNVELNGAILRVIELILETNLYPFSLFRSLSNPFSDLYKGVVLIFEVLRKLPVNPTCAPRLRLICNKLFDMSAYEHRRMIDTFMFSVLEFVTQSGKSKVFYGYIWSGAGRMLLKYLENINEDMNNNMFTTRSVKFLVVGYQHSHLASINHELWKAIISELQRRNSNLFICDELSRHIIQSNYRVIDFRQRAKFFLTIFGIAHPKDIDANYCQKSTFTLFLQITNQLVSSKNPDLPLITQYLSVYYGIVVNSGNETLMKIAANVCTVLKLSAHLSQVCPKIKQQIDELRLFVQSHFSRTRYSNRRSQGYKAYIGAINNLLKYCAEVSNGSGTQTKSTVIQNIESSEDSENVDKATNEIVEIVEIVDSVKLAKKTLAPSLSPTPCVDLTDDFIILNVEMSPLAGTACDDPNFKERIGKKLVTTAVPKADDRAKTVSSGHRVSLTKLVASHCSDGGGGGGDFKSTRGAKVLNLALSSKQSETKTTTVTDATVAATPPRQPSHNWLTFTRALPTPGDSPSASILKRKHENATAEKQLPVTKANVGQSPLANPAKRFAYGVKHGTPGSGQRKRVGFDLPEVSEIKFYIPTQDEIADCAVVSRSTIATTASATATKIVDKTTPTLRPVRGNFKRIKRTELFAATPTVAHDITDNDIDISVMDAISEIVDTNNAESPEASVTATATPARKSPLYSFDSRDHLLRHCIENIPLADMLAEYYQVSGGGGGTPQNGYAATLHDAMCQLMTANATARVDILATLAKTYSHEYLVQAIKANACDAVCDMLDTRAIMCHLVQTASKTPHLRNKLTADALKFIGLPCNEENLATNIIALVRKAKLNDRQVLDCVAALVDGNK